MKHNRALFVRSDEGHDEKKHWIGDVYDDLIAPKKTRENRVPIPLLCSNNMHINTRARDLSAKAHVSEEDPWKNWSFGLCLKARY
jgi:hypothetical protein